MSYNSEQLFSALLQADFYPYPVKNIQRIDTHISALFLTGDFVYKLKKPVDFGFLDFTQLNDRKHYCEEEIRLNRRTAPTLYLDVIPIYLTGSGFSLDKNKSKGDAEVIEYMVKIRQFNPQQQLDFLLDNDLIPHLDMGELAEQIASFHAHIDVAPEDSEWGEAESLLQPCLENFKTIRDFSSSEKEEIQALEDWTYQQWKLLKPIFQQRKKNGMIKECHGDMHLANIAKVNGKITLFDGIEFSENLRWIDVASDIAFPLMDLENHQQYSLANRLLNSYLSHTGDYELLATLNFYKTYRALVRAKVACLQQQPKIYYHTIKLAQSYTLKTSPTLFITFGFSGSGKSWGSQQIANGCGLIHIRSDVERKRLVGMQAQDREKTEFRQGLYSQDMSNKTYDKLKSIASLLLDNGYSLIVDATFLKKAERDTFKALAKDRKAKFAILYFDTEIEQLEKNITDRSKKNNDASDANIAVLHQQRKHYDPLECSDTIITIQFGEAVPIKKINPLLLQPW